MFIAGGFQRNGRRVKWLPLGRPGKPMIEELQMMVEPRKVHQQSISQYLHQDTLIGVLFTPKVATKSPSRSMMDPNINHTSSCTPVLVFQLEVYSKVDRLLTGLTAKQGVTTGQ